MSTEQRDAMAEKLTHAEQRHRVDTLTEEELHAACLALGRRVVSQYIARLGEERDVLELIFLLERILWQLKNTGEPVERLRQTIDLCL